MHDDRCIRLTHFALLSRFPFFLLSRVKSVTAKVQEGGKAEEDTATLSTNDNDSPDIRHADGASS
jgi:hypothetical protein